MALQLTIQNNSGVNSEYWRVVRTTLNYAWQTGEIELWGYVSQQARLDEKFKSDFRIFSVNPSDFQTYFETTALDPENINNVKNSYIYIKSISGGEFTSAIDV